MNSLVVKVAKRGLNALFGRVDQASASGPNEADWTRHDANLVLAETLECRVPGRRALPPELILQVLEDPSRWILTFRCQTPLLGQSDAQPIRVTARSGNVEMQVILATEPLTASQIARSRKVVFQFTSQDQGWSSWPSDRGTFRNSWTWFEAAIKHDDTQVPSVTPPQEGSLQAGGDESTDDHARHQEQKASAMYRRHELQRNKHACSTPESYIMEMDTASGFFQELRPGDVIELLACAQYGGWQNQVHTAAIEIWSHDDLA